MNIEDFTATVLEIKADLNTIIKYHPASAVYLTDTTTKEYTTSIKIKLGVELIDGEHCIKPDYKYNDIVSATLPDPTHANNLLGLVKNMVELEWGYFETYYIQYKDGTSVNLHTEVIKHLEELKILTGMLEDGQNKNVVGKLNLTNLKKVSGKDKRYNVEGMQVEFSSEKETREVIQLLANNRIKELSKPEYSTYNFHSTEFTEYTTDQIQKAINRMKQPFREYRAKWLFCKLVSETVLRYLKGEMEWNQGDIDITEKQGVFIHTLLSLFHLLDLEQEIKNKTNRDKAKYVRSFFRKDIEREDEEFINLVKVRDYPEVKFDENQWFRVTQ